MYDLAPIVLFVYNRPWHTRQSLESLMANHLADQSILYIYADGPKDNTSSEQLQKIKEVRELVRQKQWCKEVKIIESDKNKGLSNSIIDGVTEIVNIYGKIIVMEDDIVSSPFFLKFLNEALFRYENNDKVFGCSAYIEAIDHSGSEAFFDRKSGAWGWATWNRIWKNFRPDASYLIEQFKSKQQIDQFNMGGYPFYEMLNMQKEKKINSWDICLYAYSFLNNGLWLTPGKSLVKNIGFDFSGTHCDDDNSFSVEIYNEEIPVNNSLGVEEDKNLRKKREKFYSQKINPSLLLRVKNKISKYFS